MFVSLGSLETYNVDLISPMFLACSVQVNWGGPGWDANFPLVHQDAPGTERAISAFILVSMLSPISSLQSSPIRLCTASASYLSAGKLPRLAAIQSLPPSRPAISQQESLCLGGLKSSFLPMPRTPPKTELWP